MKTFKINDRIIGEGYPAYIIAEMSANHAGSIERAKDIIRAAKKAGADCIKIQTYTPDTITMDCDNKYFHIEQGAWNGETLYQLYGKAYTPWEWTKELKEEAACVGIDFFSTPFDNTAVDYLEALGMDFYKIASFELVDLPLIKYVAQRGKPIILSTGMASFEEIEEAAETIRATGNMQFAFLRCASAYPAISDEMNLATMMDMGKKFDVPVGLSDHSMGGLAAVAAVAMGAAIIEKHFCISRDIDNPDSFFSMEPDEFAQMVQDIRQVEKARGIVNYGVTEQEKANHIFRKSIFVTNDIPAGEEITEKNIRVIRPGYGLHPREYEHVFGKTVLKDVKRGMPLEAEMVNDYLELRPATMEDCQMIFEWANDAETRKQSFTVEKISWETHKVWYEDCLKRTDRELYVCYHADEAIGQYRVDFVNEEEVVVSYSIAPKYRKRGYGAEMLRAGESVIKKQFPAVRRVKAEVKKENTASQKMLLKNGYKETECKEQHLLFVKELD
ncbi:MAG: pseudaminic acid synthase [Lachnospiraceae bacterium]|nr:pseudaminic acid synthase [Lachnospiraceae bacterium]